MAYLQRILPEEVLAGGTASAILEQSFEHMSLLQPAKFCVLSMLALVLLGLHKQVQGIDIIYPRKIRSS